MASNKEGKPSILIMADWFEPGFNAGGPIRSCLYFARQMKQEYHIYIFTRDRDFCSATPYNNIAVNSWSTFEQGIQIYYSSPALLSWKNILHQIKAVKPDYLYINSMYSRYFTVYPLLMSRIGTIKAQLVLAPRGMLKSSATQFKWFKKAVFLRFMKITGTDKPIRFHATHADEQQDVTRHFGKTAPVWVVPNFPAPVAAENIPVQKQKGELALIFIGRIHPIKNLDYLLRTLAPLSGKIQLTVVGKDENPDYAARCAQLAAVLPPPCTVTFLKERPHLDLVEVLKQHHAFALPTLGENFGHAIFDAFAQGKPVVISNRTPWRNLESERAGWDIDLANMDEFAAALRKLVNFDQKEYDEWSNGAWHYAKSFYRNNDLKYSYRKLFS